jgi:hypothetical protein
MTMAASKFILDVKQAVEEALSLMPGVQIPVSEP